MKQKLSVVKIGVHLIDKAEELSEFLQLFSGLSEPKILVHGGGKRASELSEKMGVEVKMLEGRRVTTQAALEIATMVYAGLINKTIVSGLQSYHCDALGVSGADLNLLESRKRSAVPVDFGLVGDLEIEGVNVSRLEQLINMGVVPVFSAMTHDGSGQLLNTNADTVASVIASAMSNSFDVSLYYCFEQEGVMDSDGNVMEILTLDDFEVNKQQGVIKDGMIPKLFNGFNALEAGVSQVWIKNALDLGMIRGTKLLTE